MSNLFSATPSWLPGICHPRHRHFETAQGIMAGRETSGLIDKPVMYYLETLKEEAPVGVVPRVEDMLDLICRNGPAQPMALDVCPPEDFSAYFPEELCRKYYVQPFNYYAPFLSVAVLEPDIVLDLYREYRKWAESHVLSVVQFFMVTPASLERRGQSATAQAFPPLVTSEPAPAWVMGAPEPREHEYNSVTMRRLINFAAGYDRVFKTGLIDNMNLHGYLAENLPLVRKHAGDEAHAMAQASVHRIPFLDLAMMQINHVEMAAYCPPGRLHDCSYAPITVVGNNVIVATEKPTQPDVRHRLRSLIQQPYTLQLVTAPKAHLMRMAMESAEGMRHHEPRIVPPVPITSSSNASAQLEYIRKIRQALTEWEATIIQDTKDENGTNA